MGKYSVVFLKHFPKKNIFGEPLYFYTHSITVLVYDHNNNNKRSLHSIKSVKKIFAYLIRIIKNNKKMPLFPKNVQFGLLTNEMDCEKGKHDFNNTMIIFTATSVFIFQYKSAWKKFQKKGKTEKEIADMFSLKIRTVYNIIFRAEKEGRLNLKGSTGRPKKVTQRVERKIIKSGYDSQQPCTRGLALQMEKYLMLHVSHETIRNVLEKHKYSSRVSR